jgi:hypothetical protein
VWVFFVFLFFAILSIAWTQGLHLEPFHQPFLVKGFFWDRVSRDYLPGLLPSQCSWSSLPPE